MIIKSLKVFTLFMIVVTFYAFFTYFNSLDFKTDAPLDVCWAIELTDPESGQRIAGVEDVAFDPVTGTVFLSAYDRRRVQDQLDGTDVSVRGGLYSFSLGELAAKPRALSPVKLSREFPDPKFLPHGIGFSSSLNRRRLLAVNRVYQPGDPPNLTAEIKVYRWDGTGLIENEAHKPPMICNPNDLDVYWNGFFVTNDRIFCHKDLSLLEQFWDESGAVYRYRDGRFDLLAKDLAFPNGVAVVKRHGGDLLAVALTRADKILLFDIASGKLYREIDIPGAPDNLAVDDEGNIYFTIFPNLLDYYFYTHEKFFVKKTPTGVFRIFSKSDWHTIQLLYHDKGKTISGATMAQPAGDYLIMGAAWDDNIAVCSGLKELGGLDEFEKNEFF